MNVTCNGCGKTFPFSDTIIHDQACEWHGGRNAAAWGKCTHKTDRCYRPAGEAAA